MSAFSGAQVREGFEQLLASVALGEVGGFNRAWIQSGFNRAWPLYPLPKRGRKAFFQLPPTLLQHPRCPVHRSDTRQILRTLWLHGHQGPRITLRIRAQGFNLDLIGPGPFT